MAEVHQRTLRTILTGTPGLLALKNGQLAYEVANPRFCQFVAKAPAEIVGKTDATLFPKEEAELSAREERTVVETGVARRLEQLLTGAEGPRWFEVSRSPILDDNGTPAGVLVYAQDITLFKKREQALKEGEARLQEVQRQAAEAADRVRHAEENLKTRETELAQAAGELEVLKTQTAECEKQRAALEEQLAVAQDQARKRVSELEAALDRSRKAQQEAATLAKELLSKLDTKEEQCGS